MDALAKGSDAVLGGYGSHWRRPRHALELLLGEAQPPTAEIDLWAWMRNPLPPASEGPDYSALRRSLGMSDQDSLASGSSFDRLRPPDRARIRRVSPGSSNSRTRLSVTSSCAPANTWRSRSIPRLANPS